VTAIPIRARRPLRLVTAALAVLAAVAACSGTGAPPGAATAQPSGAPSGPAGSGPVSPPVRQRSVDVLPGMPPVLDPADVYAADRAGRLSPPAARARPLVYVPHTKSNDVWEIDPATYKVVRRVPNAGVEVQHVVPSYDLRTLYAAGDNSNSLLTFDPRTGRPGRRISVADPYNLYFTPDGRHAIVVAEALRRLDFYDPHSWRLQHSLRVPGCAGVDHMDFTADGRQLLASCEFAAKMIVVDVARQALLRSIPLTRVSAGMPQDVKLAPDGQVFYVADMMADGVYEIDGAAQRVIGFLPTGKGVHGLYVDRSSRRLFASNRGEGSVSVIDLATRRVAVTWRIPGGGSPDMGGVSADGRVLWLSGRYDGVVYALRTADGHLLAKIPVGSGPHGLCVWPQPGRYSLGHTGILR
jgi:DNA-binding beta-propeller fold protein YncE